MQAAGGSGQRLAHIGQALVVCVPMGHVPRILSLGSSPTGRIRLHLLTVIPVTLPRPVVEVCRACNCCRLLIGERIGGFHDLLRWLVPVNPHDSLHVLSSDSLRCNLVVHLLVVNVHFICFIGSVSIRRPALTAVVDVVRLQSRGRLLLLADHRQLRISLRLEHRLPHL